MAALYSTRLLQFRGASGDQIFTVPDGFRCVVRDVMLNVTEPPAIGSENLITGALGQIIIRQSIAPLEGASLIWQGRFVLEAGEVLTANLGTGTDGQVSGYLLTLP